MMPLMGDVSPMSAFRSRITVLLMVLFMAFLTSGQKACQNESIMILTDNIELLGNSSYSSLYTPENFTVRIFYRCYIMEICYPSNLKCFCDELESLRKEKEEHEEILSGLISRLTKLRLQGKNCTDQEPRCLRCECHPERPVSIFLRKLLELLQWSCKKQDWHWSCAWKKLHPEVQLNESRKKSTLARPLA